MKIYRGNNVEVFDIEIDDSSSINNRMMIENTLSVSVDAPDPIDFAIGDYTVVQGERYELYDIPQVDITNDTYSYDALFLGNIHRPDNYLMEQGSAPSHNFTGTLDDHVKYIVGIINTKDSGGWSYTIGDTEGVDTSFKDINYSSMSCLAALSQVATDYGVEYDITLQHIEVAKKIQRSSSFEFAVGCGKGLYKISRGKVSNQRITTRLIALGGTTNMMYGASLALDEVFVESNVDKYGLREEKVTFEWIYPRCNSKITSDATVSETDSKVWSVSDSALDFDLNLQTIEDPKIVFTTGECAGIGFSIKSYDHLTKTVLFSEFADSEPNSGNAVPNPNRRPKAGDGYNFINIIMPDSYTVRAKAELRAAAVAELSKVSVPQSPYTIEIDPRFIRSMGRKPVCGDLVRIINSSIGLDRHIRVISCTSSVKNEDDVQIVVNDDLLSSSASSLSRSVGQIKEYISQNKVDLGRKLDSTIFYSEFAPQSNYLNVLRDVYYDGAVIVNAMAGGGGGGGMLPPGVTGDILAWSAEQSLWLGKQYSELGFLTADTLSKYIPGWALNPTKPSYVIGEIGGTEAWLTGKGFATAAQLALYLPLSGGTISGALTVNGVSTFNDAVVVSATNSGAVGGTGDYTQLENLPTIGGVTVMGAKTLNDYGLAGYLNGYALTSQIPSLSGYATQSWVTSLGFATAAQLALYLPLSGGTISGALTVNGVSTFNDAVVVSATNSGAVGGTGDYTQLENLPTIGGVTVIGAKTLNDYGLAGYLNGYALTSQIPSLSGYATQSWVTSLGYVTAAHDHDTVRGVYMGNGANAQFPPDYIQKSTVKFNMRVTKVFTTSVYCDVMSMDCYYGSDIPYVTMMGITKTASPSAFIASGPKNSSDNNSWVYRQLACMDELPTLASLGGIPTTASCNKNWNWVAKDGQPNWMWGGNDKTNMYIYSPLKFNVNTARRLAPDGYTVGDYDIGATFNDPVVGYFNLQVKSPRGSVAHLNHVAVGYAVGCGNADTIDNYHAAQLWRTDNFNPADYLPLTGGTISGALTVNGTTTFNGAVVVSATNSGAGGGTSDYTQLENLPTIGGVTVMGAKTLNDYGLAGYLNGYALTSQIPSLSGYATQSWVTSQGFATAITKAQVLGVMTGSGVNTQYLAGNGTFYAIRYSEIGGTPDLSGYIKEGDSRLTNSRKASDVSAWAKASTKPDYWYSEIKASDFGVLQVNNPQRFIIMKSRNTNGYIGNIAIGTQRNSTVAWAQGLFSVGKNDAGTQFTDFVFDSNGRISSPAGAFAIGSEYLPLTGGTISGALTVNGTTTFNGAVVVSA